jgi:hypothetical protein
VPTARGCASFVARVVAGLAAAALVVVLPFTLLARSVALVLFEPQALAQAVSGQLVQSGLLRDTIVDGLWGEPAEAEGLSVRSATRYLTEEERQAMLARLVPEGWVRDQIVRVTSDLFAWFDSPSTRLVLTVDTSQVASGLEEESAGLVEAIVESWPACTLEDVGQMIAQGAVPGQQGFPFCEPPEPLRSVVVGGVVGGLRLAGRTLPDTVAIVDQVFADSDRLLETKEQVRMLRFVARWGILASLGLLGVITLVAVRSWRGLARWWGLPLLLGGVLAFLPVLWANRILYWLASRLTAGLDGVPALVELAQALVRAIGASVLRSQAWQAAVAAAIGLGLLLLPLLGRRSARSDPGLPSPSLPPAAKTSGVGDDAQEPQDRPTGMFG